MAGDFASGKHALGECDVCGQTFKLNSLKEQIVKGRRTKTMACVQCYDGDHPQLFLGEKPVRDPQALRNPRPPNWAER